jgi:hypothetical protein
MLQMGNMQKVAVSMMQTDDRSSLPSQYKNTSFLQNLSKYTEFFEMVNWQAFAIIKYMQS